MHHLIQNKELGSPPYYVWADEMCDLSSESFEEAYTWYQEFQDEDRQHPHIADGEGYIIVGHTDYGYFPLLPAGSFN